MRLDVPIMISVSIVVMALSIDGRLGFWDGVVLLPESRFTRGGPSAKAARKQPPQLNPALPVP
ncbi:MAG: hypothetical protein MZV70_71375 [Desulfobacterales bacterium]|nr:hypothetical protein [Desulfobacterales bacterium]